MLAQHKLLFQHLIIYLEENYLKTNKYSTDYNCVIENANKLFEVSYNCINNPDHIKMLFDNMIANEDRILLCLLNNLEEFKQKGFY